MKNDYLSRLHNMKIILLYAAAVVTNRSLELFVFVPIGGAM